MPEDGVEPSFRVYESLVLPLNYTGRTLLYHFIHPSAKTRMIAKLKHPHCLSNNNMDFLHLSTNNNLFDSCRMIQMLLNRMSRSYWNLRWCCRNRLYMNLPFLRPVPNI